MPPIKPYRKNPGGNMLPRIYRHLFVSSAFLFLVNTRTIAQKSNFRRHFIIAYDVSGTFLTSARQTPALYSSIISFFTKGELDNEVEANTQKLTSEKKQLIKAFDPSVDEISFFHFGIAFSEFTNLRQADDKLAPEEKLKEFQSSFIKNKDHYWSVYKKKGKTITDYITDAFAIQPTPVSFGNGVTLSNYVYPLIMDKLRTDEYAEEYVLVVISDFLTGSEFGNKKDFKRIFELYGYSDSQLQPNSAPAIIKTKIEEVAARFYRIDYFDFAVKNKIGKKDKTTGAVVSIIKPIVGVGIGNNDASPVIDGNLGIKQKGYESDEFSINSTKLKFAHSSKLNLQQLKLRLIASDGIKETVIFDDIIADREDEDSIFWRSKYTDSKKLLAFDSALYTYQLPALNLQLPLLNEYRNSNYIICRYYINADYESSMDKKTGYVYQTERIIDNKQISYASSTKRDMITIVLPSVLFLSLLWWLIWLGKPTGIQLEISGYIDTYENVDYSSSGKITAPYKPWKENKDTRLCQVNVTYKYKSYFLNWRPSIYLSVLADHTPKGFSVYLKENSTTTEDHYFHNPLRVRSTGSKDAAIRFITVISQSNPAYNPPFPEQVKLTISATLSHQKIAGLIKSTRKQELVYEFFVGPDLGDIWVAFDPGTTGSCIATGNSSENILLGKDPFSKEIIESKIFFDRTHEFKPDGNIEKIDQEYYRYGTAALGEFGNKNIASFQSIKKLLGFTDKRLIVFKNGRLLELTGKKLSSLLIKGIYSDLKSFVEQNNTTTKKELLKDNHFTPLRAVVAIPNNFTAVKIREILGCVDYLQQFKEVRYVYEAETIFFYYLQNYQRLKAGKTDFNKENVLIFDMGGATINATIVKGTREKKTKYTIDILGKLGYGIGGDTIDYCIVKSILDHKEEYPVLKEMEAKFNEALKNAGDQNNNATNTIIALQKMAFNIKKDIIKNYYDNNEKHLLMSVVLERYINDEFFSKIVPDKMLKDIDMESDLYAMFTKVDDKKRLDILHNKYFKQYIYDNITGITKDLLELCEGASIDSVIFSGRSTTFPLVKETVLHILKKAGHHATKIELPGDEAKTAVAMGACWYGLNRNAVKLNNLQINASFGVQHKTGGQTEQVEFLELISAAKQFTDIRRNRIKFLIGYEDIADDFALDNHKVNFYQVMGSNAEEIFAANQKHKLAKLTSITVDDMTSKVEMHVYENDKVECFVLLKNGKILEEEGMVSDQDITDANEEHYTWIVQ